MSKRVIVLQGEGINCERETALAFKRLGAQVDILALRQLLAQRHGPDCDLFVLPGGFSFGDEIHSGQVLALQLRWRLGQALHQHLQRGGRLLGICNGFQVLMKLGVFTGGVSSALTLTHNRPWGFIDRWVEVVISSTNDSPWLRGLQGQASIFLPIRHGEGRLVAHFPESSQAQAFQNKQVALCYREDVNGSWQQVAALTDPSGLILGMMPHPEAAFYQELLPWDLPSNHTVEWAHQLLRNGLMI
ncbi:MAG: phosphoribosylformylglycinamidine synthase subunit PurQ [Bdellovibrionaceae bacterium]|jgi:phosphoribosylformylglycinamidine synthase|nr:phosphoribosylformylglycinamidine synthase subunit PurQ [Pseudobdellovibrionaceae bacterium]